MRQSFKGSVWVSRCRRALAAVVSVATLYALILLCPEPLFAHTHQYHHIQAYSDRPLPPETDQLLDRVEQRLARSELFDRDRPYRVFFCQSTWRFALFANVNWRVGGILPPVGRNVFLRPSRIEADRLMGPSGKEVGGDRSLTYFVTHELTHTLTADALGRWRYFQLPVWVREGYADFVAKQDWDIASARSDLQSRAPRMDPQRSGLYDLYHLRVIDFLEQGHSLTELMAEKVP